MDYYPTGGSPGTKAKVDAILSAGIPASKLSIGVATTGWNQSALTSYLAYVKSRAIKMIDVWWCPPNKDDPRVNISSMVVDALTGFVGHSGDTSGCLKGKVRNCKTDDAPSGSRTLYISNNGSDAADGLSPAGHGALF